MSSSGTLTLGGTRPAGSRQRGRVWALPSLLPAAEAPARGAGAPVMWPAGRRAAHVALAPGEWAMAAPPARARQHAGRLAEELAGAVHSAGPECSPEGTSWVFARLPLSAFGSLTGPAILHHRRGVTVIYCADTHITSQAAAALAALAAQAAELLRPAGRCQVSVTRIGHLRLPVTLHPAVAQARGPKMTAYVCDQQISGGLADAIGVLSAAHAAHLARVGAGCLRVVRPVETG